MPRTNSLWPILIRESKTSAISHQADARTACRSPAICAAIEAVAKMTVIGWGYPPQRTSLTGTHKSAGTLEARLRIWKIPVYVRRGAAGRRGSLSGEDSFPAMPRQLSGLAKKTEPAKGRWRMWSLARTQETPRSKSARRPVARRQVRDRGWRHCFDDERRSISRSAVSFQAMFWR